MSGLTRISRSLCFGTATCRFQTFRRWLPRFPYLLATRKRYRTIWPLSYSHISRVGNRVLVSLLLPKNQRATSSARTYGPIRRYMMRSWLAAIRTRITSTRTATAFDRDDELVLVRRNTLAILAGELEGWNKNCGPNNHGYTPGCPCCDAIAEAYKAAK